MSWSFVKWDVLVSTTKLIATVEFNQTLISLFVQYLVSARPLIVSDDAMITPDLTSLSSGAGVVTWSAEARWRCSLGMARNNCSLVGSPALSPPKRVESLVLRLHCVASHIEKRLEFLQSILLGCGEITSLRGLYLLVRPANHSLCREQSDKLLSMFRSILNYK